MDPVSFSPFFLRCVLNASHADELCLHAGRSRTRTMSRTRSSAGFRSLCAAHRSIAAAQPVVSADQSSRSRPRPDGHHSTSQAPQPRKVPQRGSTEEPIPRVEPPTALSPSLRKTRVALLLLVACCLALGAGSIGPSSPLARRLTHGWSVFVPGAVHFPMVSARLAEFSFWIACSWTFALPKNHVFFSSRSKGSGASTRTALPCISLRWGTRTAILQDLWSRPSVRRAFATP